MSPGGGVMVAALTPRGKRGELDFGASFELIDQLCKAKVDGIALLTAAGEYPAFSFEERARLVKLGVKRSRAPVFAGVGSEVLAFSVDLAREAGSAGVDGVLLPPPLLFAYCQQDLHEYYLEFAGQAGWTAPVWIDATGRLAAETVQRLMETGKFAGVVGRELVLSTEACAAPELFVAYDCARRTGNIGRATVLEGQIHEFQDWAARLPPLVAVRVALGLRGIPMGQPPVPIAPDREYLIASFREWLRGWMPQMRKMAANA